MKAYLPRYIEYIYCPGCDKVERVKGFTSSLLNRHCVICIKPLYAIYAPYEQVIKEGGGLDKP